MKMGSDFSLTLWFPNTSFQLYCSSTITYRDIKRFAARRVDPFNRKIYRVRAVIFLARKNSCFFCSDRLARGPLRLARTDPRLIGWLVIFIFILLIVKNIFNFNANHDFFYNFFN